MSEDTTIHLMFGLLEHDLSSSSSEFAEFREGVEALIRTSTRQLGIGTLKMGLSGHGRLIGSAGDDDSFLVILGAIHKPLPAWGAGSPLDDADATATFLLRMYHDRGLNFLDDTVGAYVVALWDGRKSRFILANDPKGMRTAYYTKTPTGLAFSSTLYALNCCRDGGLKIDRSLEDFLLGYEFLPWQQTLYKDVFSLAPGMMIEYRAGMMFQHNSRALNCLPWQFQALVGPDATEHQTGDALYDLFFRCLEDVLPEDKRVAVLLGGFDSALIAAACRELGKEVDTYTFRFPEGKYNQAFAEDVAQLCGAKHRWIDITPEILEHGLSEYPVLFNQPSGMPHYLVQTAHVLREVRDDGHNHCLTGDGCDELFLGYPTVYRRARFFQQFNSIPDWVAKGSSKVLGLRVIEMVFGHFARFCRNFIEIAARPMPRRGHISNRIFDKQSLNHLRKSAQYQAISTETILASLSLGLEQMTPLRLAYHGKSMPGLNKTKLAGASSASGLTVLSPFQHPHLVAFGQSLPEEMLRPDCIGIEGNTGKRLLMRTVEKRGLLPPEIIYQPKASPVAGMADYWYMSSLKEFMLSQMQSLPFDYDGSFTVGLLSEKWPERIFRKKISLGDYIMNAPSLLVTYAAYNKLSNKLRRFEQ